MSPQKDFRMKFSNIGLWILFAAWCTCAAAVARAEGVYTGSVWTTGVTESGGWYDVDKSTADKRDDNMCYAASAANLVAWWQNGDYGRELTSSAPTDIDDIWSTYLNNSRYPTSGGDPLAAVNWWISGIYVPTNEEESERSIFNQQSPDSTQITLIPFSGFYYDRYALNKDALNEFLSYETSYTASYFGDLLSEGAGISLFLKSDQGGLQHAITLWGVDYTEDGNLSKLWITDSDDAEHAICSIDVIADDTGKIYFDEENGDIGNYDWYKYVGITGIHIYGVCAIHPQATESWQLIPEPTTTTLSLFALTVLIADRRRR
jgi:hypothetical protein